MVSTAEKYGWMTAMLVILTFAIPWFLWNDTRLLAGLPVWLWWHIAWMALAAIVFYSFTKRAWGIGITDPTTRSAEPGNEQGGQQ